MNDMYLCVPDVVTVIQVELGKQSTHGNLEDAGFAYSHQLPTARLAALRAWQ